MIVYSPSVPAKNFAIFSIGFCVAESPMRLNLICEEQSDEAGTLWVIPDTVPDSLICEERSDAAVSDKVSVACVFFDTMCSSRSTDNARCEPRLFPTTECI